MRAQERNSKKRSDNNDDEEIDVDRFFEIAETNRSNIEGLKVFEIRDELMNGNCDFELVGNLTKNGIKEKTNLHFKNMNDFESYFEKIDLKNDGEDVVFEGHTFQLTQPDFKPIEWSNYGKGCNHLFDIEEYFGMKCYIATGRNCFVKCINYLTGKS